MHAVKRRRAVKSLVCSRRGTNYLRPPPIWIHGQNRVSGQAALVEVHPGGSASAIMRRVFSVSQTASCTDDGNGCSLINQPGCHSMGLSGRTLYITVRCTSHFLRAPGYCLEHSSFTDGSQDQTERCGWKTRRIPRFALSHAPPVFSYSQTVWVASFRIHVSKNWMHWAVPAVYPIHAHHCMIAYSTHSTLSGFVHTPTSLHHHHVLYS